MREASYLIIRPRPGTSLAETNRELTEIEAILKKNPYVYTYSRRTGLALAAINEQFKHSNLVTHLFVAPSRRDWLSGSIASSAPKNSNDSFGVGFRMPARRMYCTRALRPASETLHHCRPCSNRI